MEDHGHGIILKCKDGSIVLCTEPVKSMDFIKEEMLSQLLNTIIPTSFVSLLTHYSSMLTYTFKYWHAAFGHISPIALEHSSTIFEDGHLISPIPKRIFYCHL